MSISALRKLIVDKNNSMNPAHKLFLLADHIIANQIVISQTYECGGSQMFTVSMSTIHSNVIIGSPTQVTILDIHGR